MAEKIYLIRHGESVANTQDIAAGWMDTPLSDRGRQQAAQTRDILAGRGGKPTVMVHTGLLRTFETAEIINAHLNLPMLEMRDLMEQNFGDWQGGPWARVHEGLEKDETPPNGESHAEFTARIMRGMAELEKLSGIIWAVTHGIVIKTLLRQYNADVIPITNCMICEFEPNTKQIRII